MLQGTSIFCALTPQEVFYYMLHSLARKSSFLLTIQEEQYNQSRFQALLSTKSMLTLKLQRKWQPKVAVESAFKVRKITLKTYKECTENMNHGITADFI